MYMQWELDQDWWSGKLSCIAEPVSPPVVLWLPLSDDAIQEQCDDIVFTGHETYYTEGCWNCCIQVIHAGEHMVVWWTVVGRLECAYCGLCCSNVYRGWSVSMGLLRVLTHFFALLWYNTSNRPACHPWNHGITYDDLISGFHDEEREVL